jgi:hypothetical protein
MSRPFRPMDAETPQSGGKSDLPDSGEPGHDELAASAQSCRTLESQARTRGPRTRDCAGPLASLGKRQWGPPQARLNRANRPEDPVRAPPGECEAESAGRPCGHSFTPSDQYRSRQRQDGARVLLSCTRATDHHAGRCAPFAWRRLTNTGADPWLESPLKVPRPWYQIAGPRR